MLRGGIRGLLGMAEILASNGRDGVLAVLVQITGRVHRGRGAIALLDGERVLAGDLRGGTLEQRLCQESAHVLREGRARCLDLDAAADSSFASAVASENQGSMRILLLPLPAQASPLREAFATACAEGAWLRLRFELGMPLVNETSIGFGEARAGQQVFCFDPQGRACGESEDFSFLVRLGYAPPARILLLGTGPESRPLARLARQLGWFVEVVEPLPTSARFLDVDNVDHVHSIAADALDELLTTCHFDAAIVGSHDFTADARYLRPLGAAAGIGYVALLGSPERRDALLSGLGDIVATQLEPRLYAPAGLHLGGEGPEITALAIVAQMQRFFSQDVNA